MIIYTQKSYLYLMLIGNEFRTILITGGAGFIGSALVTKLLDYENCKIINLDKFGYASDLTKIQLKLKNSSAKVKNNYKFLKIDLCDYKSTFEAIMYAKPDLIFHLAAETHVDRSIESASPFIKSNIIGTYNLLDATLQYWNSLTLDKKDFFRLIHISTDEVYGSLKFNNKFNEESSYAPNSPYSASKASSDMLVRAWNKTYLLPTIITNCSNNFGPWQFPEKLIPNTILKALSKEKIPVYGNGKNIRDWLFVDDHINALLLISQKAISGSNYCIGGDCEKKNIDLVLKICKVLETFHNDNFDYSQLIEFVPDRPGHDLRYAVDSLKLKRDFNWCLKNDFETNLKNTVKWYLEHSEWCKEISNKSNFQGERLGLINS